MQIQLKNVRHYPALSQETLAFSATLYIDGVKRGVVSNEGHGGCHYFDDWDAWALLDEEAKTRPEVVSDVMGPDGSYMTFSVDSDWIITELLLNHLEAKERYFRVSRESGEYWANGTPFIYLDGSKPKKSLNRLFEKMDREVCNLIARTLRKGPVRAGGLLIELIDGVTARKDWSEGRGRMVR